MLHAKTAVADARWARVGSTNLNLASWIGNYELDVAIEDTGDRQQHGGDVRRAISSTRPRSCSTRAAACASRASARAAPRARRQGKRGARRRGRAAPRAHRRRGDHQPPGARPHRSRDDGAASAPGCSRSPRSASSGRSCSQRRSCSSRAGSASRSLVRALDALPRGRQATPNRTTDRRGAVDRSGSSTVSAQQHAGQHARRYATGSISSSWQTMITKSGERSTFATGGMRALERPQERARERVQQRGDRAVRIHPRQHRLHDHDHDDDVEQQPHTMTTASSTMRRDRLARRGASW